MSEREFTSVVFDTSILDKWLGHLKDQDFTFLEIGTFEGRTTCYLLDNWPKCFVHTIDPCTKYPIENCPQMDVVSEKRIVNNLDSYCDDLIGRCEFHVVDSLYALAGFIRKEIEFDVVLVDGDHRRVPVLMDCVMAYDVLASGGLMIIDDYNWRYVRGQDCPDSPHDGVDWFIQHCKPEVLHKDYYVVVRKPKESE